MLTLTFLRLAYLLWKYHFFEWRKNRRHLVFFYLITAL
jgi:hypothetical protein